MAKRVVPEQSLASPHEGHEHHLCELVSKRRMDQVANLALNAKYICHICGRAAAQGENLCEPVEI